jgi:hypothetical protein
MDFNQAVFDRLRSKGYLIGLTYHNGCGLFVVINDVAMPIGLARYLDEGRVTIDEIAAGLSN